MYLRPAFIETDPDRIAALIAANPFGVLVTHGPGGMDASHIPFVVEREGESLVLGAHLAAANAQCAALDGGTALAIFSGPHAYISPGWYRTQPAVPTWDYVAVHVHGRLEAVDDAAGTAAILRALGVDDPERFDLDALEEKYRAAMFKGIRAFRLRAERIEAQWKMSQNRSAADRQGVIAALRAQGNQAVADLIEATLPPVS
ncbi:FMN-binding negative transcriptional regulator [Limobrevibacterium gyesilva]|uniref:FMN-binding negative transcriptional regulator n=1 Tax=Limobrevibacterium gyesilva TaxID=2991712 RepID=A0AA41YNV6_9PROT|nr:FMN-binding negative transcriptional regulator [Limobrevibacterium gyesilva]MCW3475961.1 FMN-binding negative transcriptional regulator [Limobrevibacterium gyesilva]